MELIPILRLLAAHRLLVLLGVLVAGAGGYGVEHRVSEPTSSGLAVKRVLIGPSNAAANNQDLVPSEVTLVRAHLLADLLSDDDVRTSIAASAGIPARELVVKGRATLPPFVQVPIASRGTEAAAVAGTPNVLRVEAADLNPIMTFTAGAPDPTTAGDIVAAATRELDRLIDRPANSHRRLAVQSLGPTLIQAEWRHPSRALVVGVPVLVLVLWCSAVVLVAGTARRLRPRGGACPAQPTLS